MTLTKIQKRLQALEPTFVRVIDDSHEHIGHAGAKSGGHYTVEIASQKFNGLSKIAQHRLVYATLGDLQALRIHALQIHIK